MFTTRRTLFIALASSCWALAAQAQPATPTAQSAPKVEAAWARPTVNGQSGGGGFLKITGGSANDRLLSASAGVSKMVELHTMEMDGNVMRMRAIDAIAIPAGATVELKPGGNHVMFMGLTQTLKAGARFPLTLRFEKAGEVKVEMLVAAQAPAATAKP
jgi:copper(I)-binding protein